MQLHEEFIRGSLRSVADDFKQHIVKVSMTIKQLPYHLSELHTHCWVMWVMNCTSAGRDHTHSGGTHR